MAKMFYSLEEVASKLDKSQDEIKEMAKRGEIQEFRDGDKLMFKVEQIDLLAGGDDDEETGDLIGLEDSRSGSGIDLKDDSATNLADSREDTGISVFDTGHGGEEDEAEKTAVGDAVDEELSLESVGSGSGLLDLTRESDDTTLGAELMEDVLNADDDIEMPANASGLFDAAGAESPGNAMGQSSVGAMPMLVESYDGGWSGFAIGASIGAIAALICVALVAVVAIGGATPGLATQFTESDAMFWGLPGGLLGVTLICGLIGFFIGKASE